MMQVSFRVKNLKSGEASGAVLHDFRKKIPGYVDRSKTSRNAILDGGPPDIPASIASQGERVRARTAPLLAAYAARRPKPVVAMAEDILRMTPPPP